MPAERFVTEAGPALAPPIETKSIPSGKDEELVVGSREQLLHLLAEAAEIEHTLMCSYLYAAFSLKSGEEDGLSRSEARAVEAWRRAIMDVAVQEMGHLLMVANLAMRWVAALISADPTSRSPPATSLPGWWCA
jgi:hypothetical protein